MGAETPKQFLELDGVPIVILSLRRIASCELVTDIIVATRPDEVARLEERIQAENFKQTVRVVRGGDSRQDSVALALEQDVLNRGTIDGKGQGLADARVVAA